MPNSSCSQQTHHCVRVPYWLRVLLAYGLSLGGILLLPWLFVLSRNVWYLAVLFFVMGIPLVPAVQTLLLEQSPATVVAFFKSYLVELTSFVLQLALLVVSMPIIALLVAGRLVTAMLIALVLAWGVVALQQLGVDIGRTIPPNELWIMFWITVALIAAVGVFFVVDWVIKKHEDSYFDFWAKRMTAVRGVMQRDISSEE